LVVEGGVKMDKVSWFRKHLNWTLVIVCFGPLLPVVIGYKAPSSAITSSDTFMGIMGIFLIVWAVAIVVTCRWVTMQKGQSLFNMFYLLIFPWGIFHILGLKNLKNW
jgi:hypothetical protein